MTHRDYEPRIGRRPILVAILLVAAVGGWAIGSTLGGLSPGSSPTPSVRSTPTPSVNEPSAPSALPTATSSTSAGPDPSAPPVLELNGDGDQRTEPFDVLVGWQIQWQTQGDRLAIAVRGDRDVGTVLEIDGPASGVTSPPVGGNYRLEITADGPWSITVIQGTG